MKNIILFLSDQHSNNVIGYNNLDVQTPFFDSIKNHSTCFNNCYCNAPLCVPSRMSFLSGQLPSDLNIFNNDTTLPIDVPTIAHAMGANGYKTVLIGRMHFKGDDQKHGFDEHITTDITSQYWGTNLKKSEEYGHFANTTNMKHCQKNVGAGYSPTLAYDDYVVNEFMNYLKDINDEPHFIVCGLYGPHFPYCCSEKLYSKYLNNLKVDNAYNEIADDIYLKQTQQSDDEKLLQIKASYYGMVETLDTKIKVMSDYVNQVFKNDVVMLYTSDHGDQCGRRKLFGKQTMYNDSIKVPLLIWGDNIKNSYSLSPVSLLDVSKTIVDIGNSEMNMHCGKNIFDSNIENNIVKVQHCMINNDYKILESIINKHYKLVSLDEKHQLFSLKDELEIHDLINENIAEYNQLKKYLLTNDEKRLIVIQQKKQSKNHELLKDWGTYKQLPENARFVIPKSATHKTCVIGEKNDL